MQTSGIEFGPLESRVLAWAQWRGVECVATVELAKALRLGVEQARQLMKRMGKKGLAISLRKGLWLLPRTLPPGGRWTPAPAVVLKHFFEAAGGNYQETGQGAFQYHGLSDQMANITTVYNTRLSGRSRIGGMEFRWIKVAESRLGHLDAAALPEQRIGSLPRVMFDALYDSAKFGSLSVAYGWIRERVSNPSFVEQLAECAWRCGGMSEAGSSLRIARRVRKNPQTPPKNSTSIAHAHRTCARTFPRWKAHARLGSDPQ